MKPATLHVHASITNPNVVELLLDNRVPFTLELSDKVAIVLTDDKRLQLRTSSSVPYDVPAGRHELQFLRDRAKAFLG